jgi:hypothetical protein
MTSIKQSTISYALLFLIAVFVGISLRLPAPAHAQVDCTTQPGGCLPTAEPTSTPTETPAPTAEPLTQEQAEIVTGKAEDTPIDIPAGLTILVALATMFASMPAASILRAALVNLGKTIGLVTDGNAPRADAILGAVLFGILAYAQLGLHIVDLKALESAFAQIATLVTLAGAWVASLGLGPIAHNLLVRLNLPFVSTSFGQPGSPPATPELTRRTK